MKKTRIVVFIIAVISAMAPFALPQLQTAKVADGQLEGVVVNGINLQSPTAQTMATRSPMSSRISEAPAEHPAQKIWRSPI